MYILTSLLYNKVDQISIGELNMREYKVKYYIDRKGVRSEEYETLSIGASSGREAIDLAMDYLRDQVIQNSDYTADVKKDSVVVYDEFEKEIIETYFNFSAESEIKKARMEIGLSRAAMSRLFEIPIRTLEDWESGKNIPAHWAEKLILEKLDRIASGKD